MSTSDRTRTVLVLYRVAAVSFALAGVVTAFNAYLAYSRSRPPLNYICQSIMAFSLCVVVVALSRVRAKQTEPSKEADPRKP